MNLVVHDVNNMALSGPGSQPAFGLKWMPNNSNSQSEAGMTLGLLKAVARNEALTQRSVASELGVALGLVNAYLKRCVKKGYIKVSQAPAKRYAYYLTPKGMKEKSRLTAEFLTQSLSLFRQAQRDYTALFEYCESQNWKRIVLHGMSDLTEIAIMYSANHDINVVGIVSADTDVSNCAEIPVKKSVTDFGLVDTHIITALANAQPAYDRLVETIPAERVLAPKLLDISLTDLSSTEPRK